MKISSAFEMFEAALKSMRAAEIAALSAQGPEGQNAANELAMSIDNVRAASLRLWAQPARGPSDLVIKARALRWHFPDGVEIGRPATVGAAEPPHQEAALGTVAIHYLVKDLLALSE